jgi:threonine 3-dehydrogenase
MLALTRVLARAVPKRADRLLPTIQARRAHTKPPSQHAPRILVTGSLGQIGSELVRELRNKYGRDNVIATDIRKPSEEFRAEGPFQFLNIEDEVTLERLVVEKDITWMVHLGALLSATGEKNLDRALKVLIRGSETVLQVCERQKVRVFAPSSIAAFGPQTPLDPTPDLTIQRPRTIYGVGKVYLELLGEYLHYSRGLDFRSLRFPGILSYKTPPGGGTTDYAIEMYHEAINKGSYDSFVSEGARLPMMYMPDCLHATMSLLEAPNEQLSLRTYNVAAFSFAPEELAREIARLHPGFKLGFKPDFRDAIARSWPRVLDDSQARADWQWQPKWSLSAMSDDMYRNIKTLFFPHKQ